MKKTIKRDAFRASMVNKTADIVGVTPRQVRRIINGACKNERALTVYMNLLEGNNKLVKEVKALVPLD